MVRMVQRTPKWQRVRREVADISRARVAQLKRWVARGQNLVRRQCVACEVSIGILIVSDTDVNVAAFQQGRLIRAKGLSQFHLQNGSWTRGI
jgi:hypothetical protein